MRAATLHRVPSLRGLASSPQRGLVEVATLAVLSARPRSSSGCTGAIPLGFRSSATRSSARRRSARLLLRRGRRRRRAPRATSLRGGSALLPPRANRRGELRGNPPPRCPERFAQRSLGAGVDAFAVPAQDAFGRDSFQLFARRTETHERVQRDALVARPVVARRPERVRADEDASLGPPERDLLPPPRVAQGEELERRAGDRLRHDVVWHAETRGKLGAVALVPIE